MIRKLKKNTIKLFGVLTVFVIVIVVTFGVFIYRYLSYDKTKYDIAVGSVLYDEDLNYILTSGEAYITQKMDKKYYMYEKKDGETYKYSLGKNAVVYKENDTNLYLYGIGYQVLSSGDVNVVEGETRIVKSSPTKLFKLDDRRYLVVDSNISSVDSNVLKTNGYVIIDLDKQGNPSFANNLLSFKTIAQVVLKGSNIDFDIANETMLFNDKKVDLKNIIGSSNEFDPTKVTKLSGNTDPNVIDGTETINQIGNGGSGGNGGGGSGGGGSGGGYDDEEDAEEVNVNNYYDEYLNAVIKSINNLTASVSGVNDNTNVSLSRSANKFYDFSRWVALKSVKADVTSITIGYSIFDPSSEYQSVYLVIDDEDKRVLDKDGSSYTILDRKPGTSYKISLVYVLIGSSNEIVKDEIDVKTKDINYEVKVTKVSKVTSLVENPAYTPSGDELPYIWSDKYRIEYQIIVDDLYKFNSATLVLNGIDENGLSLYEKSVQLKANDINTNGVYNGFFELNPETKLGKEINLTLKNMYFCSLNTGESGSATGDCGVGDTASANLGLEFNYKFYNE